MPVWGWILIIAAIAAGILIALYFAGKRMQKKQDEQLAQMDAAKQTVQMLVIDKKRVPMKESGLPKEVIAESAKKRRTRNMKVYVVKGKVGPRIMSFITEKETFEMIPVKKQISATVSGLFIMNVKGVRTKLNPTSKQLKQQKKATKQKNSKFEQMLRKGRGEE